MHLSTQLKIWWNAAIFFCLFYLSWLLMDVMKLVVGDDF
jgi:hypothetical protein